MRNTRWWDIQMCCVWPLLQHLLVFSQSHLGVQLQLYTNWYMSIARVAGITMDYHLFGVITIVIPTNDPYCSPIWWPCDHVTMQRGSWGSCNGRGRIFNSSTPWSTFMANPAGASSDVPRVCHVFFFFKSPYWKYHRSTPWFKVGSFHLGDGIWWDGSRSRRGNHNSFVGFPQFEVYLYELWWNVYGFST